MKTVLCYGDSLTWGYNPEGPSRHAVQDRWPAVLQSLLKDKALVVAEGLNGRTTAYDDFTAAANRNGASILPTVLSTHSPLDLVIILLGSNDMKPFISGYAIGARHGMRRLIEIVRNHPYPLDAATPEILLVAPPPLRDTADPDFAATFTGGTAQSAMVASLYSDLADISDCGFFDAGSVAETAPADGVHLDAVNSRAIGKGLEPITRMMLGL